MLQEFNRRPVKSVDYHGRLVGGVHRDATTLADFCVGECVGNGVRVGPNLSKVGEFSNEGRVLMAAVVTACSTWSLGWMLVLMSGLQKTEIVDCKSK